MLRITTVIFFALFLQTNLFAQSTFKKISHREAVRITSPLSEKEIRKRLIDASQKANQQSDGKIGRLDDASFQSIGDDVNTYTLNNTITFGADSYGQPMSFNPVTNLSYKTTITLADGEVQQDLHSFGQTYFELYIRQEDGSIVQDNQPPGEVITKYYDVMMDKNSTLDQQLDIIEQVEKADKGAFNSNHDDFPKENQPFKKQAEEYRQQLTSFPAKRWDERVAPMLRAEMKALAALLEGQINEVTIDGEVAYKLEGGKLMPTNEKEKKKWLKNGTEF